MIYDSDTWGIVTGCPWWGPAQITQSAIFAIAVTIWQQESEGCSWQEVSPEPGTIGGQHRPALRRGSAAITHGGLMLLMRESPPRRPAPPRGVATQRHLNLSWQTVRHATVTLPCTHSHMHRFIRIHTCAHTQIHKNTHGHTKPSFIHKRMQPHTHKNK